MIEKCLHMRYGIQRTNNRLDIDKQRKSKGRSTVNKKKSIFELSLVFLYKYTRGAVALSVNILKITRNKRILFLSKTSIQNCTDFPKYATTTAVLEDSSLKL